MSSRHADIAERIKRTILSGKYVPGDRLPTHIEWSQGFGVAVMTVQTAIKRLEREGFIRSKRPQGTFVVEMPPHLCRYGLVFWNDPRAPGNTLQWSRYYQALTQTAMLFEQKTGLRMVPFHGIDHHTDAPDRRRLIADIEAQRLAGLVFANVPLGLDHSPILHGAGMPRVAIEGSAQHSGMTSIAFDGKQWVEKALDYVGSLGCRRIAAIVYGRLPHAFVTNLLAGVEERGMTCHPRWLQFVSMLNSDGARYAAELLMHDADRPDALLIMDDNFVESSLAGLIAAGVRVSAPDRGWREGEIAVVGHANFPVPPSKPLPIRLLGYDISVALHAAVNAIDLTRRGATPSDATTLPALWEEEVSNAE